MLKQTFADPPSLVNIRLMNETLTDKERAPVLCRICRTEITAAEFSIAVNGQHEHTFTNPAGIAYRIGCFSEAYGCFTHGQPTYEFTWFAGFSWCFCTCMGCLNHLGWHYRSGDGGFFGLILDSLIRGGSIH
ncbi:MAG: hypothetical protein JW950_13570 [Deltaproteobacteria bacterium]|nr:hypothetical protein [Deltaproteobacteria bacterium]